MRSIRSLRGDNSAAKPLFAIIVGLLVVTSTVGAFLFLAQGSAQTVASGDKVKVDYIGKFEDGRVFDTSLWSVASDNTTYPKSLFFTMRGNETRYTPLEFTVGAGTMITGFDAAVRGMKVGETKTFTLTPNQAYGNMDSRKMVTIQLEESVPATAVMNKSNYKATFGEDPVAGGGIKWVTNQKLGLPAYTLYYDSQLDRAEVVYQASVNDTYRAYAAAGSEGGWDVKVIAADSEKITVRHQLTDADEFKVRGFDVAGLKISSKETLYTLYVDSVDEASGTAVLNYNREVVGHNLVFTVTVVSVA